jgi:hypothetical protein
LQKRYTHWHSYVCASNMLYKQGNYTCQLIAEIIQRKLTIIQNVKITNLINWLNPVSSQNLDFQRHMTRYIFVFSEFRWWNCWSSLFNLPFHCCFSTLALLKPNWVFGLVQSRHYHHSSNYRNIIRFEKK